MRKKLQFPIGVIGLVFGVLAVGVEGLALLGVGVQARTASFRTFFALSAVLLLCAILLTVDRLTRAIEEQPTRVQPVIDAFMAGVSMRDTPAGRRARGHADSLPDRIDAPADSSAASSRHPEGGYCPER